MHYKFTFLGTAEQSNVKQTNDMLLNKQMIVLASV